MTLHTKPTDAELAAQLEASLAELDKLETKPDEKKPDEKSTETPQDTKPTDEKKEEGKAADDTAPNDDKKDDQKPDTEPKKTPEQQKQDDIDYKKKFVSSTREGQILYHQSQRLVKAIEDANAIPEPTEEEMTKEYADWEVMDDAQKKMAKETVRNRRALNALSEVAKATKDIQAWNDKVDTYIADSKTLSQYPGLEGKEEDFKIFAGKPTRIGADLELLAGAFLNDYTTSQIKHKGSMFEKPNAGLNDKPKNKTDKLSAAEAEVIRKTDYKKYTELLKAGKIETNIE